MDALFFIGLMTGSHIGLMQIFRLSTYHRYFLWVTPILVGYGALIGWCLYALELHKFFFWLLVVEAWILFRIAAKQHRALPGYLAAAGTDSDTTSFMAISAANTKRCFALSSTLYLLAFAGAYLWLLNA